jgi:hypothetical protein
MATRIHKHRLNKRYEVYFKNPIKNKSHRVTSFKSKEDAINLAKEMDVSFYAEHPYLIPPGISLDVKNSRFRVYTRYTTMKAHSTLTQALEQRQNIIDDLVEPKGFHKGKLKLIMNES